MVIENVVEMCISVCVCVCACGCVCVCVVWQINIIAQNHNQNFALPAKVCNGICNGQFVAIKCNNNCDNSSDCNDDNNNHKRYSQAYPTVRYPTSSFHKPLHLCHSLLPAIAVSLSHTSAGTRTLKVIRVTLITSMFSVRSDCN